MTTILKRTLLIGAPLLASALFLHPTGFTTARAQQIAGAVAWYNGDWQSGIPGLANWYVSPDNFSRVYDQFRVPAGVWIVTGVFSDNGLYEFPPVTTASWEIRRGMTPGNGGDIVASGISGVTPMPDPSVTAGRYPAAEAAKHFRIQVNNLRVQLPAGRYWLSVAPVGTGKAYSSATRGANAVGIDEEGLRMALFDRPGPQRFAIAESVGGHGQLGIAKYFAQGVIIAK